MLRSIADLLRRLEEKELKALSEYGFVKHPTVLGDMHEGVARKVLDLSLPPDLDLRVVKGLIRGPDGSQSQLLDAMIVVGDGTLIPNTDYFVYPPDKVVAIFEVKRTLNKAQLADGFKRLRGSAGQPPPVARTAEAIERNYRTIVGEGLPNDVEELPFWKEMIFHALRVEALLPLRVIIGHFGYQTERGLRSSFSRILEDNLEIPGFGVTSLPELVICRSFGLVKINGLPYTSPVQQGYWTAMCSFGGHPLVFLLEMIYTRLSLRFDLSTDLFGDDLVGETASPFLRARCLKRGGTQGWHYEVIKLSESELRERPAFEEWRPVRIDAWQAAFIAALGAVGELSLEDGAFKAFLREWDLQEDEAVAALTATGLVWVSSAKKARFITERCETVFLPDGRIYAGENRTGLLYRWAAKELSRLRDQS